MSSTADQYYSAEVHQSTVQPPPRPDINLRKPSREDMNLSSQASMAKSTSSNFRPSNDSGRRTRDPVPAASLSQLRVSEDNSLLEGVGSHTGRSNNMMGSTEYPSGAKGRSNVPIDGLSQTSSVNPSLGFSSGSPRPAHGRVKPLTPHANMGAGRRQNDENMPLSGSTLTLSPIEGESTNLSSHRYA